MKINNDRDTIIVFFCGQKLSLTKNNGIKKKPKRFTTCDQVRCFVLCISYFITFMYVTVYIYLDRS